MNWNLIRINILLSKNRSNEPKKFSLQNNTKNLDFFFFSKSASGKIFYLMVFGFYTHELCTNAKNRIVISLVSNLM